MRYTDLIYEIVQVGDHSYEDIRFTVKRSESFDPVYFEIAIRSDDYGMQSIYLDEIALRNMVEKVISFLEK
jgi:hypothetical protein